MLDIRMLFVSRGTEARGVGPNATNNLARRSDWKQRQVEALAYLSFSSVHFSSQFALAAPQGTRLSRSKKAIVTSNRRLPPLQALKAFLMPLGKDSWAD